jgi:asparagine N-glycosylation enzyme membrane subunit Stt3
MQSVRVHPPLRACMSFSFIVFGPILVLLLIADFVKRRLSWDKVQLAVTMICVLGGGLGIFLYAMGWTFVTTISESGLLRILGFDNSTVLDRLQAFAQSDEPPRKVSDNL